MDRRQNKAPLLTDSLRLGAVARLGAAHRPRLLAFCLAVCACAPQSRADRFGNAVDRPGSGGSGGRATGQGSGGAIGAGGMSGGLGSGGHGAGGAAGAGGAGGVEPGASGGAGGVRPPEGPGTGGGDASPPPEAGPVDMAPPPPDLPPPEPDVNRMRDGHWRLDEGMGNVVADSSAVGNHGGTVNILNGDWKPGKRGTAISFTPARRTFMQVPDHFSVNPTAGLSIALWVNAGNWMQSPRLVQKGELDEQYSLRVEGNQLLFVVKLASGMVARVTAPAPATGKWVHLAATFDGRDLQLFVDGTSVASTPAAGPLAISPGNLTVAGRPGDAPEAEFYAGLLDDVIIYGRGLSAAEVKILLAARQP
jgi:Concanavalin A-like lectin/glucanases superfamily